VSECVVGICFLLPAHVVLSDKGQLLHQFIVMAVVANQCRAEMLAVCRVRFA